MILWIQSHYIMYIKAWNMVGTEKIMSGRWGKGEMWVKG